MAAALAMGTASAWSGTPVKPVDVQARAIETFEIGKNGKQFGAVEFVGGLDLTSTASGFGALSGFRFLSPGGDFIAVADAGLWYFGTVTRDVKQRPTGITNFTMQRFVDRNGRAVDEKKLVDAEGLAVREGVATVGFEREHRVAQFRLDPADMNKALGELDFIVPKKELRQNRGFEAIAYAPADSALRGALVAISEKSLDSKGNVFAAVLDGPQKGIFTVKKNDRFDITDGAFLPNGDLLLLERAFSMSTGVAMRLRRISAASIVKGADAVDGPILMEAGMAFQVDNMEAMDIWRRADGATMISLFSDDNYSMLQRNLYLEFRLLED